MQTAYGKRFSQMQSTPSPKAGEGRRDQKGLDTKNLYSNIGKQT